MCVIRAALVRVRLKYKLVCVGVKSVFYDSKRTRIWSPSHLEDNNAGEGMWLPASKFLCQKREKRERN